MPAAVLRPTLTSSGKPWEAAPGPRHGSGDMVGGAQHVPAASRPLGSVPFTAEWGRAGPHGGSGYGQDENENGGEAHY